MSHTVLSSYDPSWRFLSYSESFYSMVLVLIYILLAFVALLLLILLGIYINTVLRVKRSSTLRRNIETATQNAMSAESAQLAEEILLSKDLFNRMGLAVLADVFDSMDAKDKRKLKKVLLSIDIGKNLAGQLKSDNEDYLIELIRLASDLGLDELESEIVRVMRSNEDNADVQYEAFHALAQFGSFESIVSVCKDESFKLSLSFRSLHEIIGSYTGDKPALYKALLDSPDAYITRICIKHIGYETVRELAPGVEVYLDSGNINLVIDSMRTLSMLGYKPVTEKIISLLSDSRWEVRSVAVSALAALDANSHIDHFIKAMQDSEWQVRYNAGMALGTIKDDGTIRKKVIATDDKFAIDMMEYVMNLNEIGRAAK